jgi:DNA adenine methylase
VSRVSAEPNAERRAPGAESPEPRADYRPLLKWPGGKRQLLPVFRTFYPARFARYVEPFVGSGAVFFDLLSAGLLTGHPVRLADTNADLVGCYEAVRDDPDAVIAALETLAHQHARDTSAAYYAARSRFNALRKRTGGGRYTPQLAALLIYLNRTGFNGLFRLNGDGVFNVPAGRYLRPRICNPVLVRSVSAALARPGLDLRHAPFEATVADAAPGDFLYFDPPYAPLSATSRFASYTAAPFTDDDQARLCATVAELAGRGCHVMLSNSSAPAIEGRYRAAVASQPGLSLWAVDARRAINSRGSGRGTIPELLLTSLSPAGPVPGAARLA